MRDFIVQLFIVAARDRCYWPLPERFVARAALLSLPTECFGGEEP